MSRLLASLHVDHGSVIKHCVKPTAQWVAFGEHPVFVDDAETADRIARAFAELAEAMRAAAHLPPEPVDAKLAEPVEVAHG